jgi:hypothetical protein
MKGRGHLPKLFGLSALALGLMAFSASAAQAEGAWMVGGSDLASGSKSIEGNLANSEGALLTTFGKNAFTFKCTGGELLNANLEPGGAISEASKNAKVDFSGCKTIVNGKEAAECVPVNAAETETGVIISEEGYALLTLHELAGGEKDSVTVITPKVSNVFGIIRLGKECSFGSEVKVFGTLAVKDVGNNMGLELEALSHTIEEFAPLTELKAANKTNQGPMSLDGKVIVNLTSDQEWSGLP